MALPRIGPAALASSVTFIAWPGVSDVVSKSPGLIGPELASDRQYTRPVSDTGWPPSAQSAFLPERQAGP